MAILSSCSSVFVSVSCLICATKGSSWHKVGSMALLARVQSFTVSGNHMTNVESQKVCRTSAA